MLHVAVAVATLFHVPWCLLFVHRGAADTEEEAHRRADTLVDAGVVLRFNGIVYLRPQEVSELVYRVSGPHLVAELAYKLCWGLRCLVNTPHRCSALVWVGLWVASSALYGDKPPSCAIWQCCTSALDMRCSCVVAPADSANQC